MFKRHQSEAEAVIDGAISRLQVGRKITFIAKEVNLNDSYIVYLPNG